MKANKLLSLVAVAVAAAALASCEKEPINPPVENLPAVDFQYSVLEQRQLKAFTWTPASNSGPLSNGEESIKQLYVTAFNEVVIEASSPVNVSSTQPGYVAVEKVTSKKYRLVYKSDGTSHIKIWNGTEGQNAVVKGFDVIGVEYIDVTGLRFTFGGNPLVVRHVSASRPLMFANLEDSQHEDERGWSIASRPSKCDFKWMQYKLPPKWYPDPDRPGYGEHKVDPAQGAPLILEGFEPENTSFRTVIDFESEWDFWWHQTSYNIAAGHHGPDEYNNWPNQKGFNQDISYFKGRGIWIDRPAKGYIASVKVQVADGKYKYLILYYGENDEM